MRPALVRIELGGSDKFWLTELNHIPTVGDFIEHEGALYVVRTRTWSVRIIKLMVEGR